MRVHNNFRSTIPSIPCRYSLYRPPPPLFHPSQVIPSWQLWFLSQQRSEETTRRLELCYPSRLPLWVAVNSSRHRFSGRQRNRALQQTDVSVLTSTSFRPRTRGTTCSLPWGGWLGTVPGPAVAKDQCLMTLIETRGWEHISQNIDKTDSQTCPSPLGDREGGRRQV